MSDNGKKCSSCAAINDIIFTNCSYCESPLPNIDIDAISTDDLIMKASEWVGNSSEHQITISGPNANAFTGKDIRQFQSGEIIGNAEKYLSLLKIRAKNNPTISVTVENLTDKLNRNTSSAINKKRKFYAVVAGFVIIVGIIVGFMASGESQEKDDAITKLDAVEEKIENAILNGKYDYALILVDKLTYTINLSIPSNKETSKQYDEKREGYKKSINEMIERNK